MELISKTVSAQIKHTANSGKQEFRGTCNTQNGGYTIYGQVYKLPANEEEQEEYIGDIQVENNGATVSKHLSNVVAGNEPAVQKVINEVYAAAPTFVESIVIGPVASEQAQS